jgi:WD40 repeat protein/serine/threonine protein kinase/Leucine-rich repeat (LRR) protein/class 3 adenylate cyclase
MQHLFPPDPDILVLKATLGHENIEVLLSQRGSPDDSLIGECRASLDDIQKGTGNILSSLHRINLHGGRNDSTDSLESLGKYWFDQLLGAGIKHRLRETTGEFLVLELDPSLTPFPWELLHDGGEFLGCRFSVGRLVPEWSHPARSTRVRESPSFLLITNPTHDLGESSLEGGLLADLLEKDARLHVEWLNSRMTSEMLREALPKAGLLHYSGHAVPPIQGANGWLLTDGLFNTHALALACNDNQAPAFVFNNACHGAESNGEEDTGHPGFAEIFLRNGCGHFIGALREVLDEGSRSFTASFYQQALKGTPVGLAIKQARLEMRISRGATDLTWAQYVLYGDPTRALFGDDITQTEVRTLCCIQSCEENGGSANHLEDDIRETLSAFPGAERLEAENGLSILIFHRPSDAVRFALLLSIHRGGSDPLGDSPPPCRIAIHEGEMTFHRNQMGGSIQGISGEPFELIGFLLEIVLPNQILTSKPVFDNARAILRDSEIGSGIQISWLDHGPYRLRNWEGPIGICEVGEKEWAPLKAPPDSSHAWRHISPDQEPVLGWRPALDHKIPTSPGWLLVEKLGEGAFGEVWKARNEVNGEFRVYKFCFRAGHVRSLKREASFFQLLRTSVGDHPNIVQLHEIYFDEPPYFISMEYVPGGDLGAWFSRYAAARLSRDHCLEIVARVADVMQVAHDAGIIHRDIKPSNILMAGSVEDPQSLEVKLGDFGIGSLDTTKSFITTPLGGFTETIAPTEMASLSGTRLYMAPELLVGKSTSIRSDIYSLGVVLYQLIVGDLHRPLTADWRLDIEDPLLREDLEHCLAGNPSARFSSANELSRSLRDLNSRRLRRTAEERSLRKEKTRRHVLVVISLATLLITLLAASLGYGLFREREARRETEKAQQEAEGELYISSIKLAEQAVEDYRFKQAYDLLLKAPEHYRNWEWGHLLFLCNQDLMTLRGHQGEVKATVFDSHGDWLATGGADGMVRIWEPTTGKELHCLGGIHEGVNALAVSPNGEMLAAGCKGRVVELWDTSEWKLLRILEGFEGEVTSVAFHPDGLRIAAGSLDSTARFFETATGKVLTSVSQDGDPINSIALTPDGRCLATGGGNYNPCDCSARVWETDTGNLIQRFPNTTGIFTVNFSPDGKWLALGGMDEVVQVWDWRDGNLLQAFTGFTRMIRSVCFSPEGGFLAACSREGLIRLWDTDTWKEERVVAGHTGGVFGLAFSPDCSLLASAGEDKTCRLWRVESISRDPFIYHHSDGVYMVAISPDGNRLTSCGIQDLSIQVRDIVTGVIQQEYTGCTDDVFCGVFSPNGHWFAAAGDDRMVRIWDTESGDYLRTLSGPLSAVMALRFSRDSKWLVSGEKDGQTHVWDTSNWNETSCWNAVDVEVTALDWSADGKVLAIGHLSPTIPFWDPFSKSFLSELSGHTGKIRGLAFSPDGLYLASGSEDFTAILWDYETGKRIVDYQGHAVFVHDVAFTPEGNRLFTASEDNTCKVWETKSGRDLITLRGHGKSVQRMAYSPVSGLLVSGSLDGTTRLWPAFPWHESEYPGTGEEAFEDRLEAYKREFWRKKYGWPGHLAPDGNQSPNDERVNLSDSGLEQAIREQLGKPLGHLTRTDFSHVRNLSLGGGRIDLDGLRYCTNLNSLTLSATEVIHATCIAELKSLRWISLRLPGIRDLSFLRELPHLISLEIIKYHGVDLRQIADLKSLTRLLVAGCRVRDIGPLSSLSNLEYLDINDNAIKDLSPLREMTNLRWLEAHHNEIVSVTPLAGVTQLTSLNLYYNRIEDCSPLRSLENLRFLNVAECSIEDIVPLTNLSKLRHLDIGRNNVQTLTPLSRLTNLTYLSANNNQVSDGSPLANLINLRTLYLSSCPISDLGPLHNLRNLRNLRLRKTALGCLDPLTGMSKLIHLDLNNTSIDDLTPLLDTQFSGGLELDVCNTPASREREDQISALKNKGIVVISK